MTNRAEKERSRRRANGVREQAPKGVTARIEVRVPPEIADLVKQAAGEAGQTISAWGGGVLEEAAKEATADPLPTRATASNAPGAP